MAARKPIARKPIFGGWAISKQLFDWLCSTLSQGSTILELGSGSGTRELAKHFRMYSVEHDVIYLNRHASTYIHAPIVDDWYDARILAKRLPSSYDLLLVDGPPQQFDRRGLLRHLSLFDLKKPIVVDDVQRAPERELLAALARHTSRVPKVLSDGTKSFGILSE